MDAKTGKRPAVLSATDVAQLLQREFPQMFFPGSGTTIVEEGALNFIEVRTPGSPTASLLSARS